MGAGEKKIAVVLTVVLVVLIGVYVAWKPKPGGMAAGGEQMAAPASVPGTPAAGGPGCSTSGASANSVPTQEFGKKGAKVEVVAALPITHGCHVRTEAELKKAYKAHPNDVHLIIYDLFGPEGQKYVAQHGGQRAVVFINGKSQLKLDGKTVLLEKTENLYNPADIVPLVTQAVKQS